jgi:hypothetical protein
MKLVTGCLLGLLLLLTLAAACSAHAGDAGDASAVRTVLARQAYPWYDGRSDRVVPLVADPRSWERRLGERVESFFEWLGGLFGRPVPRSPGGGLAQLGRILPATLFAASGAILLTVLWRLWRDHEPGHAGGSGREEQAGFAARIAGLPGGTSLEGVDPWAEAVRRRTAGDRRGAAIWLFLAQLEVLQRAGLVRLIPGRTARQYVTCLEDASLRNGMEEGLGVFEDVYYGHRLPTHEALESVWVHAEAIRRRLILTEDRR